uniref:tryptophan N-monooxygenase CYP79A68-like n=1 Tax=Erigeron canadensis TaxID=72917 RepID=UPI001CB96B40|nr:tryptophan N-monooxygenase CYP79A68-like [Erigeron canadensis]
MIFLILFLLLPIIFTFLITRYACIKNRAPLPPGPKPLPYIGSIITMLRNRPTFRWIHRMMDEMNTKIICIRVGNVHIIAVSDAKIAREFMKDKDEIFASRPDTMSSYLTSKGYLDTALVPMSDYWKQMRRILATKILSESRYKWLKNKRDDEANDLIRYIYNQCETNVVVTKGVMDVRSIARHYTGNVTRHMVFGSRYFGKGNADGGPGDEDIAHSDSLVVIPLYVFSFCVTDYFPWLRWRTDFDGHEKIIRNALGIARKYQDPLIDERIQQWKDGVRTEENDLLDVYINLRNPRLTSDQIKAQMLDLMLASFDNTSNCIEWAIAEMIKEPKIFDKALKELDLVVGKERLVQECDLVHLNYVKACLREAFRLHPVSPFNLPHVSTVDTIVAGYFIPKGSHLLLSRRGLGRDPEFWDDPLKFNPDRHIKGDNEVVLNDHNLHILSFGTGRRGCPGVFLGSTITVMLMARLIQGFTWELPSNEPHVDLNENLHNLWKAKPLLVVVRPRLPQHLYTTI